MVKGRRVRAVVACGRNDDCCSPNPKRRGPNNAIALNPKTNTITAFFQQVVGTENGPVSEEDLGKTADVDVKLTSEGPKTPAMSRKAANASPPTPHRIEFNPKSKKLADSNKNDGNRKLTDFFPVRRSVRKTKTTVLEEKKRSLERLLRDKIEEGLEVRAFDDKGRGVVAARHFFKGDFVVEYSGDLIDIAEARKRELKYAQDQNAGCYMYYFRHNDQQYCVDATAESGRLGRLVNHSRNGNLLTRTVFVDRKPRLVLVAKDDIRQGEEITYDYGDRSKESLRHHPWLAY